jgi:hypothetical protein
LDRAAKIRTGAVGKNGAGLTDMGGWSSESRRSRAVKTWNSFRVATALALILAPSTFDPAAAQSAAGKPRSQNAPVSLDQTVHPPPPSRPADLRGGNTGAPPASLVHTPSPSPFAPIPAEPGPPISLPPASRERMHACGAEWQKMKKSGAAADKTWRDFATVCLAK